MVRVPVTPWRLLGGNTSNNSLLADTWILEPFAHADFTPTGPGCAGTAGSPILAAAPASLPWIGHTFTVQIGSVPDFFPVPVFVLGFSNPALIGGPFCRSDCMLSAAPDLVFGLAPRGGSATWSMPIPADLNLFGANNLFTQVVVFDFATGCFDALSNGMRMTIGSR